jgi:thiazole synthase
LGIGDGLGSGAKVFTSMSNNSQDFLIIGGGIIGLSIALELRCRGAEVTIISSSFPQAATHAAAGMLAPQAERLPPGAMQELCFLSRSLYADWTAKIEQITGMPTGYWECGILAPLYQAPATISIALEKSLGEHWLDYQAIHQHQPGLNPAVIGGAWYPEDGQVDNRQLAKALRSAVLSLGVTLLEGEQVQELQIHQQKLIGVITTNHRLVSDRYILATGAWSQKLLPIPIYPKKGQMLAVQDPNLPDSSDSLDCLDSLDYLGRLKQVLYGEETYIVPRRDGRIIIGATSEDVGFRESNTPEGILQLLQAALKLYPALADFPLVEQWWGFRPATADELPILGASPYPNLTLAVGHYRNGILLAPATGLAIADFLLENRVPSYFDAFSWQRFTETP